MSEQRHLMRAGVAGLGLAAITSIISCSQMLGGKAEIRQNRLYLIEAEPIRRYLKESERPYSAVVELEPFKVSRAYNRNEIVFRRSELEIRFEKHHIWAVRPPDMITDTIEQYFDNASLFTHLDRDFLEDRPEYKLSGAVKAIERYDSGDLWFARLSMSMQLVDAKDSKVIWRGDFDEERQVYNSGNGLRHSGPARNTASADGKIHLRNRPRTPQNEAPAGRPIAHRTSHSPGHFQTGNGGGHHRAGSSGKSRLRTNSR